MIISTTRTIKVPCGAHIWVLTPWWFHQSPLLSNGKGVFWGCKGDQSKRTVLRSHERTGQSHSPQKKRPNRSSFSFGWPPYVLFCRFYSLNCLCFVLLFACLSSMFFLFVCEAAIFDSQCRMRLGRLCSNPTVLGPNHIIWLVNWIAF